MAKRGNGEGSIYFSDKLNRWVAQCYINDKRRSFYGKTRKEANEKMQNAKSDELKGSFVEKDSITVYELAKEIVDDKFNSNSVSVSTHTRDLYTLGYIEKGSIADMKIQKVKAIHIKKFMNDCTIYANSTIEKIYQLLGKTFKRAIERDIIVKNPMLFEEVKKPKSDKKDKEVISLSVDEEKSLIFHLNENPHQYNNIILLMLFTGMRVGEVLALKKTDIDECINISRTLTRDNKDTFVIGDMTKTINSKRTLTINKTIKEILDNSLTEYIDNPSSLIFCDNKTHDIIKPYEVNLYLTRLNTKYQIAPIIHNHMLRHTYATRFIEAGGSVKVLQKKLGHKKIETTLNTYASVLEKFEKSEDEKVEQYYIKNKIGLH